MKVLRNFFLLWLAAVALAACHSPAAGKSSDANAPLPAQQVIRLVDTQHAPVGGVVVRAYPEAGASSVVGTSDPAGQITLPIAAHNLYMFSRDGRTLLAQTAENLLSLDLVNGSRYPRDGDVIIVQLDLTPTGSPLVSPVVDPMGKRPDITITIQPAATGKSTR